MTSKFLLIRSEDRITATDTPSSFSVNLHTSIEDKIKAVELIAYNFSNSTYNVNSTNKSFYVSENFGDIVPPLADTETITLTEGIYTGASLATEIQARLQASGLTQALNYTSTYSTTTLKLTISLSGGSTFILGFSNAATSSKAYKLLGFNKSTDTADATSAVSVRSINLSGMEYVLINIDGIIEGNILSTGSDFGHFYIPLSNVDIGSWSLKYKNETYENILPYYVGRKLNIRVLYDGTNVDLNTDWSILLKLIY